MDRRINYEGIENEEINRPSKNSIPFIERNTKWVENKKSRLEKAKEILDNREEKICTFRPQLNNQVRNNYHSRSRSSKKVCTKRDHSSKLNGVSSIDTRE